MEVALEIKKFQDSVNCQTPKTASAIDETHIKINSPTGYVKLVILIGSKGTQ